MPMATIEEHPSTSNPLTLTIMFLIQKEMSSIFAAKKHRLHDQISANSKHVYMDDGKTERDKSGRGQYCQGLHLGTYSAPFSLSLLLLVVVCKEWGISNMKLNYLSAAALH